MKKNITSLAFCLLSLVSYAQFGVTSAGFSLEASNYGTSFTIGETFNQQINTADYSIKNGILQPSYKKSTSVSSVSQIQVSLYPNPVFDYLNVETKDKRSFSYSIFDYTGKLVKHDALGDGKILVADLTAGMYVFTLISENSSYSYKFIK